MISEVDIRDWERGEISPVKKLVAELSWLSEEQYVILSKFIGQVEALKRRQCKQTAALLRKKV